MSYRVFDDRPCDLGEGPLWHPQRQQLFWFDITRGKLRSRVDDTPLEWSFDRMVSAAGWVDHDTLLIATETDLILFDLLRETETLVAPLEADTPETRSNDGRADPLGGFWIGTMGKSAQTGAGAIYRFYRGELRRIFAQITIPNAISFAPDGRSACFTDTTTQQVMKQPLDAHGWPDGPAEMVYDLRGQSGHPDGAVIDMDGNLWLAEWGAGRVACYNTRGALVTSVAVGGQHSSCPAFGGPDLRTLFVTTARQGLDDAAIADTPTNGMVFAIDDVAPGQAEHRVRLD